MKKGTQPTYEELARRVRELEERLAVSPSTAAGQLETEEITSPKLNGRTTSRSQAGYRMAQRIAHVGSWAWDVTKDTTTWSEELFRIHGLEPASQAPPFSRQESLYDPGSWQKLNACVEKAIADGIPYEVELVLVRPDDERRNVIACGQPLRNDSGHVHRLIGVVLDITERKRAEEGLRRSEATARALLNIPVAAVVLHAPDGTIVDANETLAVRMGKPLAEIIGKSAWDVYPPETHEKRRAIFHQVLRDKQSVRYEDQRSEMWNDTFVSPILDDRGEVTHIAVMAFDITARKMAEESLIKMRDELELQVAERTNELQRKNIALSEVLRQIDIERQQIESKVNANVQTLLLPIVDKLIEKASSIDNRYLMMLKQNLLELTSSHGTKLSSPSFNLTPKEIELCALIKGGFTIKEISRMQGLSERTIEVHRYNIRKKLGIPPRANLVTFLSSL